MNSERFWVVVLCVTVFCAGLAAGLLLSFRRHPAQDTGPFGAYEARMIDTFGLDEERVNNLRYILQEYQQQIDALKDENLAAQEPRLESIGRQCRELILSKVIPEQRQQEFNHWVAGVPALPASAQSQ